jgi:hypothetical protein
MTQSAVTVLYITGWCRNGSTLIGNILNEIEGFCHVGELHYLWKNFLSKGTNTRCGCGASLATCEVWRPVLETTGLHEKVEEYAERVLTYQECVRTRHIRRVLGYAGQGSSCLAAYAEILSHTYAAIQSVTGAGIIVDGSKYPAEAALLPHVQGVRPTYLHLVRDPRAIAYSWSRAKEYIPAMSASRSTAYWVGFNLASDAIRRQYPDTSLFLRYEDFIAEPAAGIERILRLLGIDPARNPVQGRSVTLNVNHTVTGNPDRLEGGSVTVRAQDVDWRNKLPRTSALAATLLSAPFMRRYGY